jgi:hypothetical protein
MRAPPIEGNKGAEMSPFALSRVTDTRDARVAVRFGVLARYVDVRNYYYLSVRGSNQVQIRKIVDGVTTVLASAAFTATVGEMHDFELRALGNELHALVDGKVVATALDADLERGRHCSTR